MKTIYLDCGMGAAGDMLAGALTELLPDPDAFVARLNALGIPGVSYLREPSVKCGITGVHMTVKVHGEEEESEDVLHAHEHHHEHDHEHHHDHDHEHEHHHDHEHEHHHDHDHEHEHHHDHDHEHHHHSGMHDIEHIVRGHLDVPSRVKDRIMAVYALIAEAESAAHGVPVDEIHFHEVGSMDAVADVTAVCLALDDLSPDEVVVSPVHVGSGHVKCAHGILPVPAPATAHILRDVPIYGGAVRGELCTPTGAALIKSFATRFGEMPVMRVERIGYGMGKKDFEAANCVRAFLGETESKRDRAALLACNLDDSTPEEIAFAAERLLAGGALDVWTTAIGMKKGRPGTELSVLCRPEDRETMTRLLFLHTSTIGVRETVFERHVLDRREKTLETPDGTVRKKISQGYGVTREKPEFEDLAKIARETGSSLRQVRERIESK